MIESNHWVNDWITINPLCDSVRFQTTQLHNTTTIYAVNMPLPVFGDHLQRRHKAKSKRLHIWQPASQPVNHPNSHTTNFLNQNQKKNLPPLTEWKFWWAHRMSSSTIGQRFWTQRSASTVRRQPVRKWCSVPNRTVCCGWGKQLSAVSIRNGK